MWGGAEDRACTLLPDALPVTTGIFPTTIAGTGGFPTFTIVSGITTKPFSRISVSPSNMSILYRTRLYVALYRLYGNLRADYLTNNTLTDSEYNLHSNLSLTTPLTLSVLQGAFQYANPASTATNFSEITNFIRYCLESSTGGPHTTLTLSECDDLITYSRASWDAPPATTDTIGTYTIVFFSGSHYVGKGNKSRCRTSAKERCEISMNPSMDAGLWGDAEPNYKTGLRPASVSQSDQSFKEEAIKILATGGPNSSQSGPAPKSYNKNNSPGLSLINSASNTLGF